jgi:predicted CXXCH cytochrome family protein
VWTGNTVDTATGTMINPAGGVNIALIGTDLSNDHPISMQYAGGGCTTTACAPANFRDPDFNTPLTATINGQQVWWLETGGNATRSKTDIILYTRTDFPGSTAAQPSVECASCHDPHTDANPTFLRVANTGSAVCLACHNK